jgi:hypothetical protein
LEELDFTPHKSTSDFRKNYRLHDLAENYGKNLLIQWGIKFEEFGKDKRYQKVWEKGKDKPDLLINYKGKKALLDWKAKHKPQWIVNKRAVDSYGGWEKQMRLPVIVCFALFDKEENLLEQRFACIGKHVLKNGSGEAWDKNKTIEFEQVLPLFSKAALIKFLI